VSGVADRLRYTWENWSRVPPASQGRHPDPGDTTLRRPDPTRWTAGRRRAWASPEMDAFRGALAAPGTADVRARVLDVRAGVVDLRAGVVDVRAGVVDLPAGVVDVRAGVLDDLATFFGISTHECVRRCLGWEADSVAEWASESRETDEARLRFYRSTMSWAFDLLWWAYLQAEGFGDPQTVIAARVAARRCPGGRHLDFGSGAGVASQLFAALGYQSDLADISASLLEFARFRLERRGVGARYLDLTVDPLPSGTYSVITAIDTLAHVPHLATTARELHSALIPGGLLFAGIDARPRAPEAAWHLVEDEWTARRELQSAGFEPVERLGPQLICYRRVHPGARMRRLREVRDAALLTSAASRTARRAVVGAVRGARSFSRTRVAPPVRRSSQTRGEPAHPRDGSNPVRSFRRAQR
jgi:SAM-dependent methyltransferase